MDDITLILQELSKQLNTTVPYIWDAMVLKARWTATLELLLNPLILLALTWTLRRIGYFTWDEEHDGAGAITTWVAMLLIGIYFTIFAASLPNIVTNIAAPEYQALEMIMGLTK